MREEFVVMVVFVAAFYYFYKILKLYAMRKERVMMIEKMSGMSCENMPKYPLEIKGYLQVSSNSVLKWAALLVCLGLGLLIGYVIVNSLIEFPDPAKYGGETPRAYWEELDGYNELKFVIIVSNVFVFGGLGLFAAFFLERKLEKDEKKK